MKMIEEVRRTNEGVTDLERTTVPSEAPIVGGNEDGQTVDIDNWVGSLERILKDVPEYMCRPGHPGRVSRIPDNIREVDIKAYEPYFLSFGPYHRCKASVQNMEKRKLIFLKYFLKLKPELQLKDYLKIIKIIEPVARSFYTDIDMETEEFVHMLLLDSLYILTMFCGMARSQVSFIQNDTDIESTFDNQEIDGRENNISDDMRINDENENMPMIVRANTPNPETSYGQNEIMGWFCAMFVHDLFLVENQLPFFVLQKIYVLVYGGSETQLIRIMKDRVGHLLPDYTNFDPEMVMSPIEEVHHLLHICHFFFRPTLQQEYMACQLPDSSQMFRLGNAMQLYEAGVRFEARSSSTQHCLIDITVSSSGKIVMPCLHVDDNTVSLLRNLIALEQMKYPSMGLDVSAYVVLLLHLVTIPEDVQLLRRKGIIQHHLASDKEMVCLVNRLSLGLSFDYVTDNYKLKPVFQELKRFTERKPPRWRVWLKHRYFSNPWTAISLLAASVLLLLSIVETYYTVYAYYRPCLNCR